MLISNDYFTSGFDGMTHEQQGSSDTRERVLESACRMFAERGFRDTTVADICAAAEANIAAVNYYFSGKEHLYQEVWREAYSRAGERHGFGREGDGYGEDWLREHIRSRVEAIFDDGPGGWFPKLLRREFANPTPLWPTLHDCYLAPMREAMGSCIRHLLGAHASDMQVRCAAMSVISQYMALNLGQDMARRSGCADKPDTGFVVKQVQAFCVGGIESIKRRLEANPRNRIP
jgi:AcrR family transcriptional regulator